MKGHLARRVGVLGLTLLIGCLATAEDRRSVVDDHNAVVDRALRGAVFLKERPPGDTPFLRTVYWNDVGPDGSFEGWADAVSRRPRRGGLLTLLSHYEIVAVNVRIRVNGADLPNNPLRRDAAQDIFQQLQRTSGALKVMVRDGSRSEPGPALTLTRTFLSGVVLEGFRLEGAQGHRGGHLRSRLMTTAPDGAGWSLQGVQIEAVDGRHLTIAGAEWRRDGSLVATGPYTLEKGRMKRTGLRGCFLIHISSSLSFRQVPAAKTMNTLCAPALLATGSQPRSPATAMLHREGRGSPGALPAAILVEQMLRFLPTIPVPAHAGPHPDQQRALSPSPASGPRPRALPWSPDGGDGVRDTNTRGTIAREGEAPYPDPALMARDTVP